MKHTNVISTLFSYKCDPEKDDYCSIKVNLHKDGTAVLELDCFPDCRPEPDFWPSETNEIVLNAPFTISYVHPWSSSEIFINKYVFESSLWSLREDIKISPVPVSGVKIEKN